MYISLPVGFYLGKMKSPKWEYTPFIIQNLEDAMFYKLLSDKDLKAMEALLDSYGGAKYIQKRIEDMRGYE